MLSRAWVETDSALESKLPRELANEVSMANADVVQYDEVLVVPLPSQTVEEELADSTDWATNCTGITISSAFCIRGPVVGPAVGVGVVVWVAADVVTAP